MDGEVAVGQDVEHREAIPVAQNLLGPLECGVDQAFTPAATDGEVVALQATGFFGRDDLVMVAVAQMQDGMFFDPLLRDERAANRRERLDRDDVVGQLGRHRFEQAFGLGV